MTGDATPEFPGVTVRRGGLVRILEVALVVGRVVYLRWPMAGELPFDLDTGKPRNGHAKGWRADAVDLERVAQVERERFAQSRPSRVDKAHRRAAASAAQNRRARGAT